MNPTPKQTNEISQTNAYVNKTIYCQANPTFVDLIEANRASLFGPNKGGIFINEKLGQMDGCVLTL